MSLNVIGPVDVSPSASMAEFSFFRCRQCGADPLVLAENEQGQFFHYRHDDPEGLDPHTDAIPLGYVDGVLTRF